MSVNNTTSVRASLGALFGTVSAAANTVTSTMNSAERGISMVDRYISTQETKQKARHKAELERFKDVLIEEMSREDAERKVAVEKFCALSPQHAHHYAQAYDRYTALLAEDEPKTQTLRMAAE